jgi:hypothetical protein
MAFFTTELTNPAAGSGYLARVLGWMTTIMDAHSARLSRRGEIEALEAKSDAELAEMGLMRHQIAHHVFRDHYYV